MIISWRMSFLGVDDVDSVRMGESEWGEGVRLRDVRVRG